MQPDEENIAEIRNMPLPEDAKLLQSFLGLVNYFKRFISDYGTITYPLKHASYTKIFHRIGTNVVNKHLQT